MAKRAQTSFTAGELTPALHRRPELEQYLSGLATCRNMLVHPHGGSSNRDGTYFVTETKDSTKVSRLIEFSYNTEDTYALEFGDQYIRVIRLGGQVLLTVSPPPAWITATAYVITDHRENGGDYYYCTVDHTSSATSEPGVGATWQDFWHLLEDDIVEIPTPYLEAELYQIKFVQSADIITICHPNHPPAELARLDHDAWYLTDILFAPTIQPPTALGNTGGVGTTFDYVVTSIATETAEESLASASHNMPEDGGELTWTVAADAESYVIYKKKNGVYGFIGIAQGTSFVDEKFIPDFSDTPASARDPFNSSNNYPSTVTYHEQRLVFGHTINDPQKIWMSQTGAFHNLTVSSPSKPDDAITLRIDASQVNEIRNLVSLDDLIVMTSGAVHKITSGDSPFAFENLRTKPQSYRGSSNVDSIIIDSTILYLQAKGSNIRDIGYTLEADAYRGKTVTVLSEHLTRDKTIIDWAYSEEPHSIIWMVRDDGVLLGLTYLAEQNVLAWHRHDTLGTYESTCAIAEGKEDATYFIVNRIINGTTKRYIERMQERVVIPIADCFFVDCGLSYDGTTKDVTGATQANPVVMSVVAHGFTNGSTILHSDLGGMIELNAKEYEIANVTTDTYELVGIDGTGFTAYTSGGTAKKVVNVLSGLDHLEGEEVAILADGNVHPRETVTSGSITLDYKANKVHAGLPYISDLGTLETPIEGTASNPKQATQLKIGVLNSRGLWAGYNADNLSELKQREDEDWGEPTDLFTGYYSIIIESTWENEGKLLLRQIDPLPITILSIVPDYDVGS